MAHEFVFTTVVALAFLISILPATFSHAAKASSEMKQKHHNSVLRKKQCQLSEVVTLYAMEARGRLMLYKNLTVSIPADTPHALTVTTLRKGYHCHHYPRVSDGLAKIRIVNNLLSASTQVGRLSIDDIPPCYGYRYEYSAQMKICETAPSLDPRYRITVPFDRSGQTVTSKSAVCCQTAAALVVLTHLRDESRRFFLGYHLLKECECSADGFDCHNFDWDAVSTPAHYEMLRLAVVFLPTNETSAVSCGRPSFSTPEQEMGDTDVQNGAELIARRHSLNLLLPIILFILAY